jgi:hypothetical protein
MNERGSADPFAALRFLQQTPVKSTDSQERVIDNTKSWRSFQFFSKVTPVSLSYEQSREHEQMQTTQQEEPGSERIDPPSQASLAAEDPRAELRLLMASATDAWIHSQSEPLSQLTSPVSSDGKIDVSDTGVHTSTPDRKKKMASKPKKNSDSRSLQRQHLQNEWNLLAEMYPDTLMKGQSAHLSDNEIERKVKVTANDDDKILKRSPSTTGIEPEEIHSVEPEHGNQRLKLPEPAPKPPPGSNTAGECVSVALMDSMTGYDPFEETLSTKLEELEEGIRKVESMLEKFPAHTLMEKFPVHDLLGSSPRLIGHSDLSFQSSPTPQPKSILPSKHKSSGFSLDALTKQVADQYHLNELDKVFIRDDAYIWVPARVLEYQAEYAVCVLDLPLLWKKMTVISQNHIDEKNDCAHHSLNDVSNEDRERYIATFDVVLSDLRVARYTDYENGTLPLLVDELEGKRDVTDLADPHLPGILYHLKARHFQGKPYTRCGDIVIALNPFSWIPDLYERNTRDMYSGIFIWKGN